MCKPVPAEMEAWRVFVLRRNAFEFLVLETDSGVVLPAVEIPTHSRVALALNAQIKTLWDLEVYSLYPVRAAKASPNARYHVVETLHYNAAAPPAAHWISLRDAEILHFADSSDFAAVQTCSESLFKPNAKRTQRPFEKPGWYFALKDLVQNAIRTIPLTLSGNFLQFTAGTSCSLIRFETNREAVWFKAVAEPNTREFPLTVLLSSRLPAYLPRVLTIQPDWNAWMMLAVPGIPLSQARDLSPWCNAARDLACLQVASVEIVGDALGYRARDVRTETLLQEAKPFFTLMRALMERQPKSSPPRLSHSELDTLELTMREALLALQRERVPDTVGHLDLNPDNIMARSQSTVFLDWAETSVGHPFFSFAHLLEHGRAYMRNPLDWDKHLVPSYLAVWAEHWNAPAPTKTLCLAFLVAVFAHAVSTDAWRDGNALRDPRLAGYYRSLSRRMKSYADRLHNGASRVSEVLVSGGSSHALSDHKRLRSANLF